jgi:hypothetical protein
VEVASYRQGEPGGRWALAMFPHHLEHLAPLCEMMDAIAVVRDTAGAEMARRLYPGLTVIIDGAWPPSCGLLAGTIYYSHLLSRERLRTVFNRRSPPRVVHCPHGVSEKQQNWSATAAMQDIALVNGSLAYDQFEEWGVRDHLTTCLEIGNIRLEYYRRHQAFFDTIAADIIADEPAACTVLYAPTWVDGIGSSSFASIIETLIRRLPPTWRLIAKLHPHLERQRGEVAAAEALVRPGQRVTFLRSHPLTWPWLTLADVYVGDMSSLAYDFLRFDKPMVLLNQLPSTLADARKSRLFQCGLVAAPSDYASIFDLIDQSLQMDPGIFSNARRALYAYAYAQGVGWDLVRTRLQAACDGPAPAWMIRPDHHA